MRQIIPAYVISLLSEIVSQDETHATLDSLFMYADAPGDPPALSKPAKVQEWLRRTNKDDSVDPLEVLGKVVESYMEAEENGGKLTFDANTTPSDERIKERKDNIKSALARANLYYINGGRITSAVGSPSRSLQDIIRDRDFGSIENEFERALVNVEQKPREAISAACNILEAVCKTYIQDEDLEMPRKQDLQPVWNVVRKDLGLIPDNIEDRDLQEILSGIFAVVHGIGALRTHASSAHGTGRISYRLQARHARLAIHAAHTIVSFILESWDNKKNHRVG